MARALLCFVLGLALGVAGYALARPAEGPHAPAAKHKVVIEQKVPLKFDGKEAKVTVWELEKAPGAGSAPHRHPGPVFGYVLEGELEVQVGDGPRKVYRKGEMFYEPPRALHRVSRNPSKSRAARFLTIMLTAADEKEYVLPERP